MRRYINLPKRNVHGILLLDKPVGLSSSFVSYNIKKLFYANKVGHAGTLDPIATGMLPICFGKATKFVKYLLNCNKKYRVLAKLGKNTDTFDRSGTVIKISAIEFTAKKLEQCLNIFKGKYWQIPPMFSSLKYRGVPLYTYARKGIDIPRKPRLVYIHELYILRRETDIIELDITCSKGTYIRSFVNDLGNCLGCGAFVSELHRLMIGKYLSPSMMVNLKTLESIFYNKNFNDFEVLSKLDSLLITLDSLYDLVF